MEDVIFRKILILFFVAMQTGGLLLGAVSSPSYPTSWCERVTAELGRALSWKTSHIPRSATELLAIHRESIRNGTVNKPIEQELVIHGIDYKRSQSTVYNPAGWFDTEIDGKPLRVFAGRVESLRSETDTKVGFFVADAKGELVPLLHPDLPSLNLQDPFVTRIGNELILGGVEISLNNRGHVNGYKTVFYRDFGTGITGLTKFTEGPPGMKDIRPVALDDGRILVFTRPQGRRKGGRGKIGFTIIDKLTDLTGDRILKAPLIKGQFLDDEWGGVNAAYLLKNGKIGVLGHIARFKENGSRQYYSVTWAFDPKTGESTPMEIVLAREDLPGGLDRGHKREDLKNVIFSGQLIRLADGTALLTGGEGDRRPFMVKITDPLLKYETP